MSRVLTAAAGHLADVASAVVRCADAAAAAESARLLPHRRTAHLVLADAAASHAGTAAGRITALADTSDEPGLDGIAAAGENAAAAAAVVVKRAHESRG